MVNGIRLFGFLLVVVAFSVASATFPSSTARAYINQANGTIVPQSNRLQACLDLAATAETTPGAVNALADAAILPDAFRPVPNASGSYDVTFIAIGEGAGYRNSFGWFWIGDDITNPANLRTIFDCRTTGSCACPCTTTRTVVVDFDTQPGFAPGRPIGFWLRTPERIDGSGSDPDNCGSASDTANRIYFTSQRLNDDGDYVHFLVYRSATRPNTFYFGFEDLWRGGDNDFEDMLVRATGLVPTCDPRPETCNNADDDCDGRVDEGLTMPCSTACGSGVRTCSMGSYGACSARTPTTETCNAIDDDCDGSTDEGLSRSCRNACGMGTEICIGGTFAMCNAPTPSIETCNASDDDCDGSVDESLTRTCYSACGSGIESCVAGRYGGCTAPAPMSETCNASDDDCDGRVDEGLVRDCSNACGSGTERCVAGAFVDCSAPMARIEACNAVDDDCDGRVDENLTQACSTACGVGTERCSMGGWVGCDAPTPRVEECNNVDDDCDGVIDDGNPGGGATCVPTADGGYTTEVPDGGMPGADGGIVCANGRVVCIEGALVCRGATSGSREVCNCVDDDCDGRVDEDPMGSLCPGGICVASECACADPCISEEFPCPPGRICDRTLADPSRGIIGYCVAGRCAGVTCGDEEVCNPETGRCENLCEGIRCGPGYACVRGACIEDNCYGRGCPVGQVCRMPGGTGAPQCMPDPCGTVSCGEGEFCREGRCVRACLEGCPAGEVCVDGTCVTAPCEGRCTSTQTCVEGVCVENRCLPACGPRRTCRVDVCIDDPCASIACPEGTTCVAGGQCTRVGEARPAPHFGLAAGGGGCTCAAAGSSTRDGLPLWAWAAALVFAMVARRRNRKRALRGATVRPRVLGVLAALLGGCAVDPYCFVGCEDAGPVDAGRDARVSSDGCVATGNEMCNERDDDCDGRVDEDFDLQSDPAHCGRCDTACRLPHAFPACREGECAIERCEIGWHDLDRIPGNGCEYGCPPSGDELCDERDNDCDGRIDEGFDLMNDLANCGRCGNLCEFPNAEARCSAGTCTMGACRTGFVDIDRDASNGCEYRCTESGAEVCNGVDDDCDRAIDEGFDRMTDPANCGACGRVCRFPQARARCAGGTCTFGPDDCEPGYYDVDRVPETGCEYACTPTGGIDDCDGIDDDCDGRIDEADPRVGTACGTSTGACEPGRQACVRGMLTCAGGIGPAREMCNGMDDDCDGGTDESTAAEPIPGVGDRCGATDVGRCEYGQVVCSGGTLTCGGTFVGPTTETCNGIDDDCNGAIDDRLTPPPSASVPSCAETRGVCAGRTPTCRGAAGWGCDLPATYQAVETRCDGLDNDCDGMRDEGCLTPVGSDVRLDTQDAPSSYNSLSPFIIGTGSGGSARIHVAWTDLTGGTRAHLYETRSLDGGATWSAPRRVDTASGPTFASEIALAGSSGVVWVWPDFRGGTSSREIWTRRSTDGGVTLQSEVRVNPGSTYDSYGVVTATVGSNVYVAFEAFTGSRRRHVFFSRSTDGGATFSAPVQLPTPTGSTFVAAEPQIAASGSNVYVIWRDNRSGSFDIYLRRSNDSGATFAAEQRIDVGTPAGASASFSARIAAQDRGVWVVWVDDRDGGSFDIWMNRSTDSGATWLASAVKLDGDPLRHDSIEPRIVASSAGNVVVAWIDYRSGFPDPMVTLSTNGGATWSTPERLDTGTMPGTSGSYDLELAVNGNLVAAVWSDDRAGLLDVYANYSLDGGATWQPQDYRLDTSPLGSSDSQDPAVWVSGNGFHVVWVDHRRGSSCPFSGTPDCPNGDIFYRRVQ